MKNLMVTALLGTALSLAALTASAQHDYVRERPHEQVVKRPERPSVHHVWVGAEWRYKNGKYEEVPGHWDQPPQGHREWIAGHWVKERRGSYWVPGHWN